jgi:hypothetical protein
MTSEATGAELDALRARVGASDLTGPAVGALSPLVRALPFEALTPVKQLLKRYFSDQPWTDADDAALAELVGAPDPAGAAAGRVELAPGLVLVWAWADGPFRLRLIDDRVPTDG